MLIGRSATRWRIVSDATPRPCPQSMGTPPRRSPPKCRPPAPGVPPPTRSVQRSTPRPQVPSRPTSLLGLRAPLSLPTPRTSPTSPRLMPRTETPSRPAAPWQQSAAAVTRPPLLAALLAAASLSTRRRTLTPVWLVARRARPGCLRAMLARACPSKVEPPPSALVLGR